ncbi:Limonene-1,2-epoxide hydrolase [Sinobacterium norvegicum]|uniref:Limonene-1,2-epoxide hydrolase n=1 Tax=Sinobacterium norvegicum TaxID=1641715 RepID=A0ABM9AJI6_9GAMM|nr:limonene-1,2-epoxide hydrolase family protein [Sinobacterium norvegicum]CAH0993398.1 Limonene-1,2-epoxide hydrolase [Sinobacterium norvegicum]
MNNSQRVKKFVQAIMSNKMEDIVCFFAEDIRYHNIPMQPRHGKQESWEELSIIHSMATDIDWQLINIAENDQGQVMTERLDRYKVNGQWAEFEVMGIFEFEGELIKHWRDYFDIQKSSATLKLE